METKETKQKKEQMEIKVDIPEGVEVSIEKKYTIHVKKGDKSLARRLTHKKIKFSVENNQFIIKSTRATRSEKKIMGTYHAHMKNTFKGITEGHEYLLRICSDHFPMNVSVKNNIFEIKNFLGEKFPRIYKLKENVNVSVKGSDVIVKSIDKEIAGLTAGAIEQLTRIKKKDRRIFQDGIFIVNKDGKLV